jgi:hypothetical protein
MSKITAAMTRKMRPIINHHPVPSPTLGCCTLELSLELVGKLAGSSSAPIGSSTSSIVVVNSDCDMLFYGLTLTRKKNVEI